MKFKVIGQFIIICLIYSCATTTTTVVEEKPEITPEIQVNRDATTCTTLADLAPGVRSSTEDAFTLYRDEIRFKRYTAARKLWKVAYYNAPGSNGSATYHFDDGIKIYDHLFRKETDEARKAVLVDTILSIYDKRLECFPDDGTIKARKAFNSYYSYSDYTDSDETFALFKEVLEMKDLEADYFIINPFSKLLYDRVLDNKIDQNEAQALALKILDIIEHGKANCEDEYCEAWEIIGEYSPPLLSGLEGIRGFYPCDYYMAEYYPQYEANPENCDTVTMVYLKMVWANCDQEDERFKELKMAKDSTCYVPPPPPGPITIARDCLENGDFECAIEEFNKFVAKTDDPEKKAQYLLLISKIYYAHIKNFPAARRYAIEAASHKGNWGEPYMLIGKLYASSGPLCGPGRGWDSQIVTWAAIDKFNYAKRIDPSVATEANKWISRYQKYMPSKEDIFFRQLNAGDRFYIPCWIQERTTIRTSD